MEKTYIKLFLALSFGIIMTNCTSDDSMVNANDFKLIKSYTSTDTNETYLNRYYEYANGLLTKVKTESGDRHLDFDYNQENRVIRENSTYYEYNSDGKISSMSIFDSIIYDSNKIIYQDITNDNGDLATIAELTIDSNGRIAKIFSPNYSCCRTIPPSDVTWQYAYDEVGNLINSYGIEIPDAPAIEYDDKKNPFYYAFQKINTDLNYFERNRSIAISVANENGLCPNNIVAINHQGGDRTEYTYEYDESGYPISVTYRIILTSGTIFTKPTMKYEYY